MFNFVVCLISFEDCLTTFSFIVVDIYMLNVLIIRCLFLFLFMVILCYGEA